MYIYIYVIVYIICIYTHMFAYIYIYIYTCYPPSCTHVLVLDSQLTRKTSECVSPLFESTVGEVPSVQHQPSIFVVAHTRKIAFF